MVQVRQSGHQTKISICLVSMVSGIPRSARTSRQAWIASSIELCRFQFAVLIIPPQDKLTVLFVIYPNKVFWGVYITTKYERLNIPLDFTRKARIDFQRY